MLRRFSLVKSNFFLTGNCNLLVIWLERKIFWGSLERCFCTNTFFCEAEQSVPQEMAAAVKQSLRVQHKFVCGEEAAIEEVSRGGYTETTAGADAEQTRQAAGADAEQTKQAAGVSKGAHRQSRYRG